MLAAAAVALLVVMVMALVRAMLGPTIYDRILAVNVFGTKTVLLIAVVALVVMGPQRLPQAMRTLALWWGRARQIFGNLRRDLENEVGMDDIRRQLHNEKILRELKESTEAFERPKATTLEDVYSSPEGNENSTSPNDSETPQQDQK